MLALLRPAPFSASRVPASEITVTAGRSISFRKMNKCKICLEVKPDAEFKHVKMVLNGVEVLDRDARFKNCCEGPCYLKEKQNMMQKQKEGYRLRQVEIARLREVELARAASGGAATSSSSSEGSSSSGGSSSSSSSEGSSGAAAAAAAEISAPVLIALLVALLRAVLMVAAALPVLGAVSRSRMRRL